jgi:hypothetical protein
MDRMQQRVDKHLMVFEVLVYGLSEISDST